MKKILIILLGIMLVGCGAKRDIDYISISDYCPFDYYIDELKYDETEIIKLIIKDIENADIMHEGYSSLIKTNNYIIVYEVCEIKDKDYLVYIYDIEHGDKEYIDYMYNIAKESYENNIK